MHHANSYLYWMDWVVEDHYIKDYHHFRKVREPIYMLLTLVASILGFIWSKDMSILFLLFGVTSVCYMLWGISSKGRFGQLITHFSLDEKNLSITYLKGDKEYHLKAPRGEFRVKEIGMGRRMNPLRIKIYHKDKLIVTQYEIGPWDHRAFDKIFSA